MGDVDRQLLEDLVALMREEFGEDLLGLLVCGSRIYGTPGPSSDIDVHVVITQPRRRRCNLLLHGIEVELFINPPFRIQGYFDNGPGALHMFAFGRILYDLQAVVAGLQEEARRRWEAGPTPVDPLMHWRHRYVPADLLRDLHDVGDDQASVMLLIVQIVERLIESHYHLAGRWPEKFKRRLTDLERWTRRQRSWRERRWLKATSAGARRQRRVLPNMFSLHSAV